MSVAVQYDVTCDADGCDETYTSTGGTQHLALSRARSAGWKHRIGADLCPAHEHWKP